MKINDFAQLLKNLLEAASVVKLRNKVVGYVVNFRGNYLFLLAKSNKSPPLKQGKDDPIKRNNSA